MRPVYLFTICCSVLALSLPAMAVPQFDWLGSTSQYYLSLDADSGIQSVEFSLLGEEAGFAKWNRMGIYNRQDPLEMLELIQRSNEVGDSVVVMFDLDNQEAWVDENEKISIGPEFGFYLDNGNSKNKGGLFYSETILNDDRIVPRPLIMEITKTPNIIISFEDMKLVPDNMNFNGEIDDLVIGISSGAQITVVPEPATIAMLGFGYLIFLRKKT